MRDPGVGEGFSPRDVLDYVTGAERRSGATARDLSWRTGLSRARASELLGNLPANVVERSRAGGGEATWRRRTPASTDDAQAAWCRFLRVARRRRRVLALATRPARVGEAIQVAWSAMAEGDIDRLRRLLRDPLLDAAAVRRGIPPRWRDPMCFEVLRARCAIAMEQGLPHDAVEHGRRALALARGPEQRVSVMASLGPALRMLPGSGPQQALRTFEDALSMADQIPDRATARTLRRLLHSEIVAPLLVVGASADASRHAERSMGSVSEEGAEWAQSTLRQVQILAARREPDEAARLFDDVKRVANPPRWLAGLIARYEPTFLGDHLSPEEWSRSMEIAWAANVGYGFQRQLIVARIAAAPSRFVRENWSMAGLADLARVVAAAHQRRHGARPSDCPECGAGRLPERAAHALGVPPGWLSPELCT